MDENWSFNWSLVRKHRLWKTQKMRTDPRHLKHGTVSQPIGYCNTHWDFPLDVAQILFGIFDFLIQFRLTTTDSCPVLFWLIGQDVLPFGAGFLETLSWFHNMFIWFLCKDSKRQACHFFFFILFFQFSLASKQPQTSVILPETMGDPPSELHLAVRQVLDIGTSHSTEACLRSQRRSAGQSSRFKKIKVYINEISG